MYTAKRIQKLWDSEKLIGKMVRIKRTRKLSKVTTCIYDGGVMLQTPLQGTIYWNINVLCIGRRRRG